MTTYLTNVFRAMFPDATTVIVWEADEVWYARTDDRVWEFHVGSDDDYWDFTDGTQTIRWPL